MSFAQSAYLVKDIYPGTQSSRLGYLTNLNGTLFFAATDDLNGNGIELWTSDGTAIGTTLVKNIATCSFPNSSSPQNLTNVSGTLLFSADDCLHGRELWRSDGRAVGTTLVKDIYGGLNGFLGSNPSFLTAVGSTLFFAARDPTNGTELWNSDGSDVGTVLVTDIVPGTGSSSPSSLINVNGTLFFAADDGVHGVELWKSDGTSTGTLMVKDIFSGNISSSPSQMLSFGGLLYFVADDGINGRELWKSDGTETGTQIVKDISPGGNSSNPTDLAVAGSRFFFAANDGTTGVELWLSDGSTAGTKIVRDIRSGSLSSSPTHITAVGSNVFFAATEGTNGIELWTSDGSSAGTVRVKDINAGIGSSTPQFLVNGNGTLFFNAWDGTGYRLWRSDGSELGTTLVPGGPYDPAQLTPAGPLVFFEAHDASYSTGSELWAVSTESPPSVTAQPSNQTVCSAGTATFIAVASGNPTPTVQWQVSTNGGATFTDIAGATSTTLSFTVTATDNGNQYRAVFTNVAGTATSNAATLSVNTAPTVATNPTNQAVNSGQPATFTAAASGSPTPMVQWQVSTNGGATFTDIVGATSTTLSFTTTAADNGNRYRAVFTNVCGTATTTAATLSVDHLAAVVSGDATICPGRTTTIRADFTGPGPVDLTWSDGFVQNGVVSSPALRDVSPAVTTTYTITSISNANGPGTASGSATVTVDPACGSYYTVQPCRVVDTRGAQGPALGANTTRSFQVGGLCNVPSDAKAVAVVVTAVGETDFGDLRLFPTGGTAPLASAINFAVNHVRAGNGLISLGTGGQVSVQCDMPMGSTGITHFVLDVMGYFK